MIDRSAFQVWIDGYERAWRSPGTAMLRELFTEDARYYRSPYADPVEGIEAIARMWEAERDGPDEVFTMAAEIVAVERDTGVGRVLVRYGDPVHQEYRDLWVVRFAEDGRCSSFEEWPFWPGQPWTNAPD
jgi:ketosteroid isomerase-like protein